MSNNIILSISEIICKDNYENLTLIDIAFAINKVEEILNAENIRKKLIENELSDTRPEKLVTAYELNKSLNKIQSNILNLEIYLEVLESKRRVLTLRCEHVSFLNDSNEQIAI